MALRRANMEDCHVENFAEKRASERTGTNFSSRILFDGKTIGGQVVDISAGGAKVSVEDGIKPATHIVLSIARFGEYSGEIVWFRNAAVGIKFTEDPAVTSDLAYAMAVYGP